MHYPASMSISLDIKSQLMQCQFCSMFDIKKQSIFCVILKVVQLCNTGEDLYLLIDMTYWWVFLRDFFVVLFGLLFIF